MPQNNFLRFWKLKKMLHILFLPSWYPNHKNDLDGNFIQNHAKAVAIKHKVSVLFITSIQKPSQTFTFETKEKGNLTEYYGYYKSTSFFLLKIYRWLKCFYSLFNKIKPFDGIHVHVFKKMGILGILFAFFTNKKIILTEQYSGVHQLKSKSIIYRKWHSFWYKKYDAILPVSNSLKVVFEEIGISQHKLNVVYNVVDTSIFKPNKNRAENTKFEFLHISNFAKIKNVEGILIAFKKLLEDDPNCNLTILGDGNLQDVVNHANGLKIPQENIHFVGKIMPDFLAVYYQNADTFILNSHKETFGVVLAESLCCGCPVITTKNGGYSDEMTTEEGFVIPPNDSEALLEAMKKMIATKNQWHRDEIAQNAVSKFGETAISEQLNTIYLKIFNS